MKTYLVRIPIVGSLSVEVEAANEQDAKEKAFEKATWDDMEEWEPVEHVTQGNVCYARLNNIEVTEK